MISIKIINTNKGEVKCMGDIYCVCGEPWNYWGAIHGDLNGTEYDVEDILKGRGCPACGGRTNANVERDIKRIRSITNNTDIDVSEYI